MCNFLSALVTRQGEVLCDPATTDSHEDLIKQFEIRDDKVVSKHFVRVEFTPDWGNVADLSSWQLKLDENEAPSWWDEEFAGSVKAKLESFVSSRIVTGQRKCLEGEWWIAGGDAVVGEVRDCRVVAVCGNVKIDHVYGNAEIDDVYGSAKIDNVNDNARIRYVCGNAKIGHVYDNAKIDRVYGNAKIDSVSGDAKIDRVYRNAEIDDVYGSAKIDNVCGSAEIGHVCGNAEIGHVYDNAKVSYVCDNAKIVDDCRR